MLHVLGGEAWIHEATEPAEKLLLAFCCAVPAALQTRETKANKQKERMVTPTQVNRLKSYLQLDFCCSVSAEQRRGQANKQKEVKEATNLLN